MASAAGPRIVVTRRIPDPALELLHEAGGEVWVSPHDRPMTTEELHEAIAGADAIVTPCPLCHLSLDAWQQKAEKKAGRQLNIPILHLAQLLGAAAGIREDELKFKRHVVRLSPEVQDKLLRPEGAAVAGD